MLLFVQQAVLACSICCAAEGTKHEQTDALGDQDQTDSICEACVALGGFSSALPPTPLSLTGQSFGLAPDTVVPEAFHPVARLAFSSRAPPYRS